MSEELKPCPFCGGEAEYYIDNQWQDKHVVACENCGCERRNEYSKDGVVDNWNTRHITPKQQCADEMYEAIEASLRIEQLWIYEVCDEEHAGEAQALHSMRRGFINALAKARGEA